MTQTTKTILLSVLVSLAVTFTAANWLGWGGDAQTKVVGKESVYDRVMRTKTIRCGYTLRPGFVMKDVNSGQLSGVVVDYVRELGNGLSFNVEWNDEIAPGEVGAALDSGKIDLYCAALWPNAPRARVMDMVMPIATSVMGVYIRNNETRQFTDYGQLNDSAITVALIDGTAPAQIIQRLFPAVKKYALPQLTPHTDLALAVESGKADFALIDSYAAEEFMAHNAGKIRQLMLGKPFAAFPNSIALKRGEYEFKRMLEISTLELIGTGVIEKIVKKYEQHPGTIIPVASPASM